MDFFDSRYFRINKFFLSVLGLWPYQEPTTKFISLSFAMVSITVAMLPQVIYFLEYWYYLDEMYELMPTLCGTIMCFGKLAGLTFNTKKFKELIDRTHEDWINMPKDQDRQILTRYAETARKFTIVYSTSIGGLMSCYVPLPFVISIFETKSPNETSPRKLLHHAEYFVSPEKYYYVLMFIEIHAYVICAVIVIAADNIYFLLLEHICGMQSILCHRLENLTVHEELQWTDDNDPLHKNNEISQRVRRYIQLDKRIRGYVKTMEATFATSILVDLGLGFIFHTTTCIMFIIQSGGLVELVRYTSFLVIQSCRFFLISWTGQEIIDHSSVIPAATYDAMWYRMPPEIQKNLMLLIVRSQKFSQLTVAKFYIINLENFSTIMKTSVSYCTIMTSIR